MTFFNFFGNRSLGENNSIIYKIKKIFSNNTEYAEYIDSLSDILIDSDVGIETTELIINKLKSIKAISNDNIKTELFNILYNILLPCDIKFSLDNNFSKPFILLVCGTNGVGKTTTVVKIANMYKNLGKKVYVVAGDTYRAAAIEQLSLLCYKNFIPIIKQHTKADSASVIYDSIMSIKNKDVDLIIVDTSGRLHTNNNLMLDLLKIKNVIKKIDSFAPHEVLMVIDTNVGQNAINQVSKFKELIQVSGLCLSKFDGSSKCGVIFNLASTFLIPIRYVCFGEKINDIDVFNPKKFLSKLL